MILVYKFFKNNISFGIGYIKYEIIICIYFWFVFFKLKEKYDMKNEFFGLKKLLFIEEFNSFYLVIGIDVDGRMEMIKKVIE